LLGIEGEMLSVSEPVNVRLLRGPSPDVRGPQFGMLLARPRVGARMVLLLAPRGRMTTSQVVRVLEAAGGGMYVQTENSLYLVEASLPSLRREAV
jgi:hypothetical protein